MAEPSSVSVIPEAEPSEVLHKLDQLLNKHRPTHEAASDVPTLTEALEEAIEADIPVLLDEAALAGKVPHGPQLRLLRQEITQMELRLCLGLRHQLEQAARDCPQSFSIEARAEFQVSVDDLIRQLPGMVHRAMMEALRGVVKS